MKLMRVGATGAERPAALVDRPDGGTEIVDLSSVIDDVTPASLAPDRLPAASESTSGPKARYSG